MADCCKINGGIDKGVCGMAKGGLKGTIYAANFCEIASYTKTGKNVTAITMEVDPLTSDPYFFYKIAFKNGTAGFNNEAQIGNNTFSNQTLTFSAEGLTPTSLATLEQLMTAEVVFIVTDARGVNHLLGRLEGMTISAATIGAGTAVDDLYGATLTFLGEETELSNIVASGTTINVWDSTAAAAVTVTLP
jgi:hypothetical protein